MACPSGHRRLLGAKSGSVAESAATATEQQSRSTLWVLVPWFIRSGRRSKASDSDACREAIEVVIVVQDVEA